MSSPLVSIIIPIYKTEVYVRDCLESVQKQTLDDFEAILVNDGTPDRAMFIAKEFREKDDRFRILTHQANRGLGAARNTGIIHAQGRFLNFLDSDDQLPSNALEIMVSLIESRNADMVVGNMAWNHDPDHTLIQPIDQRIRQWQEYPDWNIRQVDPNIYASGSACHKLYRRDLIDKHQIRFTEDSYWEDAPFSLKTWMLSEKIIGTESIVYLLRKRADDENPSITQSYGERLFLDRDRIAEEIYAIGKRNQDTITDSCELARITLIRIVGKSRNMLKSVKPEIKKKMKFIWFPQHFIKMRAMMILLQLLNFSSCLKLE